jgi:hypothetical protein
MHPYIPGSTMRSELMKSLASGDTSSHHGDGKSKSPRLISSKRAGLLSCEKGRNPAPARVLVARPSRFYRSLALAGLSARRSGSRAALPPCRAATLPRCHLAALQPCRVARPNTSVPRRSTFPKPSTLNPQPATPKSPTLNPKP